MIKLTSDNFRSLTHFELQDRWTGAREGALPEEIVAQFQPLTRTKAAELWKSTFRYRDELWSYAFKKFPDPLPDTSSFTSLSSINANSEGIEGTTRKLIALNLPSDEFVIVMWDRDVAMGIPWNIFYNYWSDLCFPSSDDVSICPISETWFLQYHHEDQFIFGKIKNNLPAFVIKKSPVSLNEPLPHQDEILHLLQTGDKIAAVKLYQKETGIPFKAAIEAVAKLMQDLP